MGHQTQPGVRVHLCHAPVCRIWTVARGYVSVPDCDLVGRDAAHRHVDI